jgi:hypothetical protein
MWNSMVKLRLSLVLLMPFTPAIEADELDSLFKQRWSGAYYIQPPAAELNRAASLFVRELAGATPVSWNTLPMEAHALKCESDACVVVMEPEGDRSGRGFYLLRNTPSPRPWLLQAPHSRSDRYTEKIVKKLMEEGPFRAAAWNTMARKTPVAGGPGKADLAHIPESYWQAFTQAFALVYPHGRIIQIHGFAKEKRKSASARKADMILSFGNRHPPPFLLEIAACMKKNLTAAVLVFPWETRELGATTNAQGKLLHRLGHGGFVHVEMSKALRKKLVRDADARKRFIGCLQ